MMVVDIYRVGWLSVLDLGTGGVVEEQRGGDGRGLAGGNPLAGGGRGVVEGRRTLGTGRGLEHEETKDK